MLTFVTTCHPEYAKAFVFPTLSRLTCRVVVLLDPSDKRELPQNVERYDFASDRFYQQGKFLDAFPHDKDDIVILADADAVVQRDFNDAEQLAFDNLGGCLMAGPNMYPGQGGAEELDILKLIVPVEEAVQKLRVTAEVLMGLRMYNWGLVAGKASTWKRLQGYYEAMTFGFDPQTLFLHPTWLQYLLCAAVHRWAMPVVEMPYTVHSHQHFSVRPEHNIRKGQLYYGNELVMFAHWFRGVTH